MPRSGYEVLAIDLDEKLVDVASRFTALAVEGDGTDEELLRSLQVDRSDVGIVSQGSNLEASILSTMLLKKLGVPYVVSKAKSELHGEVLRAVGADRIVFPEHDEGAAPAHSLAVPSIVDYIPLAPLAVWLKYPPQQTSSDKRSPSSFRQETPASAMLLIRRGQYMIAAPSLNERIEHGDDLIVAGPDIEIERFMTSGGESERE